MTLDEIIKTFCTALISTVGAFVPIFGLMYSHYFIRKNFYQKVKKFQQQTIDFYQKTIDDHKKIIQKICNNLGLNNHDDLLGYYAKTDAERELQKMAFKAQMQIEDDEHERFKADSDKNYMENYSFSHYLSDILNRKFPDSHFSKFKTE